MAIETTTEAVRVWFDPEADLLEVTFEDKIGYFKATADDRVMVRVDMSDRIIGFQILGVSTINRPLDISLAPRPGSSEPDR
jgi:uncharacterized protein YuzE